eukprot:3191418-Amphidinium_carterae.1
MGCDANLSRTFWNTAHTHTHQSTGGDFAQVVPPNEQHVLRLHKMQGTTAIPQRSEIYATT